jgi:hypothetical protein
MLEKRKRFKQNQLLLKLKYLKYELKNLLWKSLKKNHFCHYTLRLSINWLWQTDKSFYFKTHQKLICPFSLSKRIPNKNFSYSRFFLNKKLNTFNINNVFK